MIRLTKSRRQPTDSIVPMINVAFLLLVFFLMVAVIAPPDPLGVELPEAQSGKMEVDEVVISVNATGEIARGAEQGPFALADVNGREITIRADADLEGAHLAAILADLNANGAGRVTLAVTATPMP